MISFLLARCAAHCLHYNIQLQSAHCAKSNTALSLWFEMNFRTELEFTCHKFRDLGSAGTNRAETDGLAQSILGLSACFQSVMEASYVMKAARRALTHNHSCILLFIHS